MTTPEDIDRQMKQFIKQKYHVVLYRNHCSHTQLTSFLSELNPRHIILLSPPASSRENNCLSRKRDIHFWSRLQFFPDIETRFDYIHQTRERQSKKDTCDETLPESATHETCQVMNIETPCEPSSSNLLVLLDNDSESDCSEKTQVNLSLK